MEKPGLDWNLDLSNWSNPTTLILPPQAGMFFSVDDGCMISSDTLTLKLQLTLFILFYFFQSLQVLPLIFINYISQDIEEMPNHLLFSWLQDVFKYDFLNKWATILSIIGVWYFDVRMDLSLQYFNISYQQKEMKKISFMMSI